MTFPESPETLELQLKSLKRGLCDAVLVTHGEDMPEIPKGMNSVDTDVGTFIYNSKNVSPLVIKSMVEDDTYHELLGHLEPKSDSANGIVIARKNGIEAKSSIVSPHNIEKQSIILKKQFPGSKIDTGGEDKINEVLNERIKMKLPKKKLMSDEERHQHIISMMSGDSPDGSPQEGSDSEEEMESPEEEQREDHDQQMSENEHGMEPKSHKGRLFGKKAVHIVIAIGKHAHHMR